MISSYGDWGTDWTYYAPHRVMLRAAGYIEPQAVTVPPPSYGPPYSPQGPGWSPYPAATPGNVLVPPGFQTESFYPLSKVPGAPDAEEKMVVPPWLAPVGIGSGVLLLGLLILGLTAGRRGRRRVY